MFVTDTATNLEYNRHVRHRDRHKPAIQQTCLSQIQPQTWNRADMFVTDTATNLEQGRQVLRVDSRNKPVAVAAAMNRVSKNCFTVYQMCISICCSLFHKYTTQKVKDICQYLDLNTKIKVNWRDSTKHLENFKISLLFLCRVSIINVIVEFVESGKLSQKRESAWASTEGSKR